MIPVVINDLRKTLEVEPEHYDMTKFSILLSIVLLGSISRASAGTEVLPQDALPKCAAVYATLGIAQEGGNKQQLQAYTIQILHRALVYNKSASAVSDPLRSWGNALLECLINRYKPAHTSVYFNYT